jgi:tetratricopeptide (TPR) repeat protein
MSTSLLSCVACTMMWAAIVAGQSAPTSKANEHFRAGMVALASEKYEKAEAEFRNAVELDPLHDAAFYGLGQVYMATRRYHEAVKAYLDSREAFKAGVSAAKFDAATHDRRVRDQLQAVREYGRTLQRMSPTQSPGLAAALERNREDIRQLEARLNRSTGGGHLRVPAGLSMALGSAYYRTGDLKGAEREYVEAIKVEPKFGEAHNNLAVIYMITGRFDEAEREIDLAEKSGFKVNPQLKADIRKRRGSSH